MRRKKKESQKQRRREDFLKTSYYKRILEINYQEIKSSSMSANPSGN